MSDTECPTCGKDDFTNKSYMHRHHKLIHKQSLREKYVCTIDGCENVTYNPKYCSQECLGKDRRKYEYHECKRKVCDNTAYEFDYCSTNCANKETWKKRDNPAKRPEVRKKISEARTGITHAPMSKEGRENISKAMSGKNHPLYGVTGKDHPSYGVVSGLKMQKVKETGHTVRSNWEKDIDLMLHKHDIDYEYEPKTFELASENTYTPDFIVKRELVIEVKGWPNEISVKRAKLFMKDYPEFKYIVVGNKIPCDIFIDWKEREKLIETIRKN